jgi:hypothetical protein
MNVDILFQPLVQIMNAVQANFVTVFYTFILMHM